MCLCVYLAGFYPTVQTEITLGISSNVRNGLLHSMQPKICRLKAKELAARPKPVDDALKRCFLACHCTTNDSANEIKPEL